MGAGVRAGCGAACRVLLLREDLGVGMMMKEHVISMVPGMRLGTVQAVCACGYRSTSYTREHASRAAVAGNAHLWARWIEAKREREREQKERGKELGLVVKELVRPALRQMAEARGKPVGRVCWCGRGACACVAGCPRCRGCSCSCECYRCPTTSVIGGGEGA